MVYDGPVMDAKSSEFDVVVVGAANIDIQGQSLKAFKAHDSNPGRVTRTAGGVGRNIAENCARLGLRVALLSAFSDDADGRWLEEACRNSGFSTEFSSHSSQPSATYLCLLDADGSLAGAVADMGIVEGLSPEFLETRRALLDSARAIVAEANLPCATLAWLAAKYGRGAGLGGKPLLFFDPVSAAKAPKAKAFCREFDCMKPNLSEARILSDQESGSPEEIAEALGRAGRMPGELFISMGREGLFYASDGDKGRVMAPAAEKLPPAVNRSGAGDAALAAIVWARLKGLGMRDRARMALAAAALSSASGDAVSRDMTPSGLEAIAALIKD